MSNNFISVTKQENSIEWQDIIVEMREFIRDYLIEGGQIISEKAVAKKSSQTPIKKPTREFSEIETKDCQSVGRIRYTSSSTRWWIYCLKKI